MTNFILLTLVIVAATAGDVSVTRAMKAVGEVSSFRLRFLIGVAARAARNRYLWFGVFWKAVAFFTLLALLSRADLSWVVPATAASFVVETLAAKYLLSETVSLTRWVGALCVCLGVVFISF